MEVINGGIVQTQCAVDILAHLAGLLDYQYPIRICVGEIVNSEPQRFQTAEHAEALHATHLALFDLSLRQGGTVQRQGNQIAGLYVPGVGDDLHRCLCADLYLAHKQSVCVLVRSDGQDLAHYHLADAAAFGFKALYLRTAHGHAVAEFLDRDLLLDIIRKPFH